LVNAVGVALTRDFIGSHRSDMRPVIVGDTELPKGLLGSSAEPPAAAKRFSALAGVPSRLVGGFDPGSGFALGTGGGVGSNNWVVSGSLTETGMPILANDPHLAIQMPSIWYEVELFCPATEDQMGKRAGRPFHVRGFTFAGTPGVVIGHNERIAWGVTNVSQDVQDLYIEKVNPDNPSQYEVNGRWVDMKVTEEAIGVRNMDEPVVLTVRETRHGPIVTDEGGFAGYRGFSMNPRASYPGTIELKALALRWTAREQNHTFRAVVGINDARDFREFREALRSWDIPAQNFVYADVDGNIGYQCAALLPIRRAGDGSVPSPGWTDEFEWTGFIPFEELPWVYNPSKGYIVTANNPVASEKYKHFIGGNFDHGYRAARIVRMIEGAGKKIGLRDIQEMQGDLLNTSAKEIIPFLEPIVLLDKSARQARGMLLGWDCRMEARGAEAAVFSHFWLALADETFKDQIPRSLRNGDAAFDDNSRLQDTISRLLREPRHPFWDNVWTPEVRETRDDILALALEKAVREGTKVQGGDVTRWQWGKEHTAVFRNQTLGKSGIRTVERIFNRGPVAVGGGSQQVLCTDWKFGEPFGVYFVSSLRHIVDLSDLGASMAGNTTGQSGHPASRHYGDMIEGWRNVTYHPTFWDRSALAASRPEKLVLSPGKEATFEK
jgi:penicillin amidase